MGNMIFPSNAENHENMISTLSVFTKMVFFHTVLIITINKKIFNEEILFYHNPTSSYIFSIAQSRSISNNLIKSLGLTRSPTTFDGYDFLLIFFTCSTNVNASVAEIPYLQERLTKNCQMKEFLCDN